ncbi:MAG TPA: acetyl-CoA C-acyltransferase [Bacteroidia bacterium]|jgi:acetyl-CoA C-acetyltransferase|nr:acetyl-CoA C-acyltransferase [Bacteroidia bacterium]
MKREVYIVSAVRTPIGSFGGSLSEIPAVQLGAIAIRSALEKIKLNPAEVNEVFMGNVLQAGIGQAPATQASIKAGIPNTVPTTTVNKVCASGMKAIMWGAQSIQLGEADVIVAGGMENMSMVPYYLDKARKGYRLGNGTLIDGMVFDGLTDPFNHFHMGNAGELCAKECHITREEQDAFAITSYKRSAEAWKNGYFKNEVVPVEIPQRKGNPIIFAEDEEYKAVNFDKIPSLSPVFQKDGTITAANASTLNDGASAVVLMSKEKADKLGIKPLAKIIGYGDAAQAPEWFTTAPSKALPKAVAMANLKITDIDFFEINEAFSVVALANNKELKLSADKVNVHGGAVALGHPLGSSGSRIVVTLINVLKQHKGKYGAAGICNGGGGASAIVIENV